MEKEYDSKLLLIKLWMIILYRKKWIIFCYLFVIILAIIITILSPKEYISNASILINSSSYTNLAEINPFVLSDAKMSSLLSNPSQQTNIDTELEIIKSPLVLKPAIIENNLKYTSGEKKGEFITPESFLNKKLKIENKPRSSIIEISYKSSSPKLSYNVVKSLIKNYTKVIEIINSSKASRDRFFLENIYQKAKQSVDKNLAIIKEYKSNEENAIAPENTSLPTNLILLTKLDKRIKKEISFIPKANIDQKKLSLELEGEVLNLQKLKERYLWSVLVEKMSKNASKIIILKQPEKLRDFEYIKPNWLLIIIFSLFISFNLSCLVVIIIEKIDKKITFMDVDQQFKLIKNDYSSITHQIEEEITFNNIQNIGILLLIDKQEGKSILNSLNEFINNKNLKEIISIVDEENYSNIYQIINNSEKLFFLIKIGFTQRDYFNKINNIIKNLNKSVTFFILLS